MKITIKASSILPEKEFLKLLDYAQNRVREYCSENEYVDDVSWGESRFIIPVFESNPQGPNPKKPDKRVREFVFSYDPTDQDYNAEEQLHVRLDEFFQEWDMDRNEDDYEYTGAEFIIDAIEEITADVYAECNGQPGYTYKDYAQEIRKQVEEYYDFVLGDNFTMYDIYDAMDEYDWTF